MTGEVVNRDFEWITPRYMADFSCVGPACVKNCCHGWQIAVDEPTYRRLKESMRRNRSEREEFKRGFERNQDEKFGKGIFARIAQVSEGACPFLNDGGLCSIHSRFGDLHLGLVCRTYPKVWSQYGRRLELFGDLSCPEVARRLLLDADALELGNLTNLPSDTSALLLTHRLRGDEPSPYVRHLDDIRQVGLYLLGLAQYPLNSRLFFLACFSDAITPFFHRDSDTFSEDRLAAAIEAMASAATLREIEQEFQAIDSRTDFSMDLVKKIMLSRISLAHTDFGELLEKVLKNGTGEDASCAAWGGGSFQDFFEQRKASVERLFAVKVNRYFENYCRNFWLGEWYVDSPSPAAHVRKLLVRLAVLRVLFFCHPGLNLIVGEVADGDAVEAQLDGTAVEVFSAFSRGVEHNRQFIEAIEKFLTESGHEELAIQAMLLKV